MQAVIVSSGAMTLCARGGIYGVPWREGRGRKFTIYMARGLDFSSRTHVHSGALKTYTKH